MWKILTLLFWSIASGVKTNSQCYMCCSVYFVSQNACFQMAGIIFTRVILLVTKGGFLWRQAGFFLLASGSVMVGIGILWEFVLEAKFGGQSERFCSYLSNSAQWGEGENQYLMVIVLQMVVRVLSLEKYILSLLANSVVQQSNLIWVPGKLVDFDAVWR